MTNRARLFVLLTTTASATSLVLTVARSRRASAVTAALVLAVVWAVFISAVDAVVLWRSRSVPPLPDELAATAGSPVTYVVRLGDERRDIARTSILLAARAGDVHVVSTRHHDVLDELGDVSVVEHVAPTIRDAVHEAAGAITTDAVLLLSASAFPLGVSCEQAATLLTADVGWVTGTAPAFNHDRYSPRERELLSARARGAARSLGLVTWEPDATIVRTDLLREHAFDPARPDGRWLRARMADGYRGAIFPDAVAVLAAPADAPVFWPTRTIRQRGMVADLADAMTFGKLRARALAGALLLRELFAYPLLLWLAAIVLIGRSGQFPLRMPAVVFFGLQLGLAAARWVSSRLAYGIGLHPIDEARAAAYDLPGSLLALPSALTRRVRRSRFTMPEQPLLWAALAVTLVTTAPLVDRRTETNSAIGVTVGLALAALATSWVFAMRGLGSRGWDRASYRIALDRSATVNGHRARTVDASPSGLGVTGVPESVQPGDRVSVWITFDDSSALPLRGTVTDRRVAGGSASVGIALELTDAEHVRWVHRLFSAAGITGSVPTLSDAPTPKRHLAFEKRERAPLRRRLATLIPTALLILVSALVASALLLAFLGYRPMVERSGSMVPTIRVGDVVVTELVHPDRIRPGQIVTFPQDIGRSELVTHRVRSVRIQGSTVHVVTRGDANIASEQWTARTSALVGRVVWRVPWIGSVLVLFGSVAVRGLLLALSAAGIAFGAFQALHRRRALALVEV
jgi:signal peptidase I